MSFNFKGRHMPYVRAMCAIGQRGQLGLRGRLPWEGERGPEYRADVERFWELTRGHIILVGPRTKASVPEFAYCDRTFVEIRSNMTPTAVLAQFDGRVVFVGGGPPIWSAYAPFIRHWDITRLPYDGEADRWFDPAWMTCGEVCAGSQPSNSASRPSGTLEKKDAPRK